MRITLASLLVATSLLCGCAATVQRESVSTPASTTATTTGKRLAVEIGATQEVIESSDWEAFVADWRASLEAAGSAKGMSVTLTANSNGQRPDSGVLAKVKVNEFRYVSQAKRFLIGIFSGNASMDVEVEFFELPDLKSVGVRKYQTSSSAWQGVFSAMTPKQVEAVVKEVVAEASGK